MKSLLGAWLTRAQTMLLLSPEANDAPREFLGEQRPIKNSSGFCLFIFIGIQVSYCEHLMGSITYGEG
jgi:hypothetical protein